MTLTGATLRGPVAYFFALLVVVATWAIGMPRFSAPDEPAHIYKAYGTAHGELLGAPAPGFPANLREFDGPDVLGPPNLTCYIGRPTVPASCATEISPRLISSAARYPPWYYALVGVPVAATGQADRVLPYRLVSAVLCVALLALAMLVSKRGRRADVVALQLAGLTPMALFLMGSVNPNAIEIAVFVAVWACLSRVATDERVSEHLLILASCLSAGIVLIRPISIVWMAATVVVAVIAMSKQRRRELLRLRLLAWAVVPTALALVGSWVWLVYSRMEVKDPRMTNTLSLAGALRRSISEWGGYWKQAIGVLGWLDTMLPSFAYVAWFFALLLVVALHLRSATRATVAALLALIAIWLALPLVINGFTNSRAGLTYQGRYSLPIFVGVVFLPMFNGRARLRAPRVSQRSIIAAVLALVIVAEVGSFWEALRRFTVGVDGKIFLTGALPWRPAIAPMLLVALNTAAMVAVAWSALRPWPDRQVD
jgi:hypothetical protein